MPRRIDEIKRNVNLLTREIRSFVADIVNIFNSIFNNVQPKPRYLLSGVTILDQITKRFLPLHALAM